MCIAVSNESHSGGIPRPDCIFQLLEEKFLRQEEETLLAALVLILDVSIGLLQ